MQTIGNPRGSAGSVVVGIGFAGGRVVNTAWPRALHAALGKDDSSQSLFHRRHSIVSSASQRPRHRAVVRRQSLGLFSKSDKQEDRHCTGSSNVILQN